MSRNRGWIYLLPCLHLCVCSISYLGVLLPSLQYFAILFEFVLLADLPISIVTYLVAWKYPGFGVIWTFVVGTAWWYLLSRGLELLVNAIQSRKISYDLADTLSEQRVSDSQDRS